MKLDKNLFYKVCRVILIGHFLLVLNSATNGQLKTKQNLADIKISGGQNGNLHTDGSNLISLITKDTSTTFTIKSSQGIVWQHDKYTFFVDSLKKGKTTITIYKTEQGKDIFAKAKIYKVLVPKLVTKYNSLSISPDISLGGFTSGKIKLDTLKKITSILINENYTILQARFYIGQNDLQEISITSKYFDNHLKELWKRIEPNCTISIDDIEFMDKSGNRYFYPKSIAVTAVE